MKKIGIVLPHNFQMFEKEFVMSLLAMQSQFYEWRDNKEDYGLSVFVPEKEFRIDAIRNQICSKALKFGSDYILCLDTDHLHHPQTITYMLEDFRDNPEIDCITGIYHEQSIPFFPQLFLRKNNKFWKVHEFPLNTLFEVQAAGFGVVMIKREVFEKTSYPWFKFIAKGEDKDLPSGMGEDLYFFEKAKPKMLCDSRIQSLHHNHTYIGTQHYLDFNQGKIDNGMITITPKQVKKMLKI